jgi:RNA polymerase sigma-70 factor, ECF subfamily
MHLTLVGKPDPSPDLPTEDARDELLARLMARVARQDEAALAELYRQVSRTICAFALRRLSDPVLADEIVVETMYEVWRHGHRFAGQSRVTTWVLGIARHKILDRLRQRGNSHCETLGEEAEEVADDSPDFYVRLAERQQAAQIALCLEALPEEQRECIHLVFYEDLALAEIAEIQGCPTNTVKTRLFHARRKIRECLERQIKWQDGAGKLT